MQSRRQFNADQQRFDTRSRKLGEDEETLRNEVERLRPQITSHNGVQEAFYRDRKAPEERGTAARSASEAALQQFSENMNAAKDALSKAHRGSTMPKTLSTQPPSAALSPTAARGRNRGISRGGSPHFPTGLQSAATFPNQFTGWLRIVWPLY